LKKKDEKKFSFPCNGQLLIDEWIEVFLSSRVLSLCDVCGSNSFEEKENRVPIHLPEELLMVERKFANVVEISPRFLSTLSAILKHQITLESQRL
jgi:hypothetical protein